MKVGILGSGFMGRTHARAYAKMKGVEIAAISSHHLEKAETLANKVGGRATNDNLAIIDDPSIDAISNTLPTYLHAEYTIAALKAGKHVLLEKPFALTAVACDGMIAAQKESGKVLLVAHVLRFWGDYVSLIDFVQSGKIGKPLSAVATRLSQLPGWADWFLNPAWSGGAVLDLCVHDFDVLNWILGQPKSVYARRLPVHRGVEGSVRGRGCRVHVPCRRRQCRDGRHQLSRRLRTRQILRLGRQARRRLRESGILFRRLRQERAHA